MQNKILLNAVGILAAVSVAGTVPSHAIDPEVMLLAQIMVHEAESEGEEGMKAVGEVVMNRVASDLFPNTISEVVYQKKQFSNSSQLAKITPTEEELALAEECLTSEDLPEDVLYFRNAYVCGAQKEADWGKHEFVFSIGNHSFYTQ